MPSNLSCVMLIDDNPDDSFFHEREIKKSGWAGAIIIKDSGADALEYLKSKAAKKLHPELIFLDINMPGMNGWEFLHEYNCLDKELQISSIIIMLTTSDNPADVEKAKKWSFVNDYKTKPLTSGLMNEIMAKHFPKMAMVEDV